MISQQNVIDVSFHRVHSTLCLSKKREIDVHAEVPLLHAEIALPADGEKSLEVGNEQKMC